jgi:hypothetical protein
VEWLPFEHAREFVRGLHLLTQADWASFARSAERPANIPYSPWLVYKDRGWVDLADWLGVARSRRTSVIERRIAHELSLVLGDTPRERSIRIGPARPLRVDYAHRALKVVVEYDGSVWHEGREAEDGRKSERLRGDGWRVVRIREHPLRALHEDDIEVPAGACALVCAQGAVRRLVQRGVGTTAVRRLWRRYLKRDALLSPPPKLIGWRTFAKARGFVRGLGLKNQKEWNAWAGSDARPEDIPYAPDVVYAEYGWQGLGDFLGTGTLSNRDLEFVSFEKARAYAQGLGLRNRQEWARHAASGNLPKGIPASPRGAYLGKGWTNWGDFLGTGNSRPKDRRYRNYEDAAHWAQAQAIRTVKEWRQKVKKDLVPSDIPAAPHLYYEAAGWTTWGAFLGTGQIANRERKWRPFAEAREFARSLEMRDQHEWKAFVRSSARPPDLPARPEKTYREWVSWADWLGESYAPRLGRPPRAA